MEGNPSGTNVVGENFTQFVVGHLANERDGRVERRQSRGGVRCGATGDFHRWRHRRINGASTIGIGQLHRTLHHSVILQEGIIGLSEYIDNRIANAEHIEGSV
jgi:hypothetical protein